MFGHLKAEHFMNLIEGEELSDRNRAHLQACTQCSNAFASAQEFHAEITESASLDAQCMDVEEIPEPDWFQFRADVRNAMLSRAAQRQSKTRSWSGWMLRPAMSWGLAVAFAAGLSAGLMLWNRPVAVSVTPQGISDTDSSADQIASLDASDASNILDDVSVEPRAIEAGLATWSQASVFEELSQLSDAQAEKLQRLLETDVHPSAAKP